MGLTFADCSLLAELKEGSFVGQHGSWNRKPLSGYQVIFVPFTEGKPSGIPVGMVIDKQGDFWVADDLGNTVWRVSAQ